MRENEVLAAEREALSHAADSKGLAKGGELLDRVIESVRRQMASKKELCEKESIRLNRQVTHRENTIDILKERLLRSIKQMSELRDAKDIAIAEAKKAGASNVFLRGQREAAVDKRKELVEKIEEHAADKLAADVHRKEQRADLLAENEKLAAVRGQKKDNAHSIELIVSVRDLRAHLAAKTGKGARMALLSQQYDARVSGRATLFSYSQAAIGMEYRIMSQRAKPLKKSPSDEEDGLAYLTRLLEVMITDDVKEGRYDAGRLQEAQAAEVLIARELPVISEEHTSAYSKMLKKKAKEEAAALMDVEDDPVLVGLMDEYVGEVLFDEDDGETYLVRAVQYGERGSLKYYEATCVRVEQGESGSWSVPSSSFVAGSEVLKDDLLVGYALMDLTEPDAPVLLSAVGEMISAHSARETEASKEKGASKKRQNSGEKKAGKPKKLCAGLK